MKEKEKESEEGGRRERIIHSEKTRSFRIGRKVNKFDECLHLIREVPNEIM
jgi:hypothetical protein